MNRRGFIFTTLGAVGAIALSTTAQAKEKPAPEAFPLKTSPTILIKDEKIYWQMQSKTGWRKGDIILSGEKKILGIAAGNVSKRHWGYVLVQGSAELEMVQ